MHDKVVITSECPSCHKEYKRLEYVGIPIGVLGLTICQECAKENTDEYGNWLIKFTNEWSE